MPLELPLLPVLVREPEPQPVLRPPLLGQEPVLPVRGRAPTCSTRGTKPRGDRELLGVLEEVRRAPLPHLPPAPVARSPVQAVAARALLLAQLPAARPALQVESQKEETSPVGMHAQAPLGRRRP